MSEEKKPTTEETTSAVNDKAVSNDTAVTDTDTADNSIRTENEESLKKSRDGIFDEVSKNIGQEKSTAVKAENPDDKKKKIIIRVAIVLVAIAAVVVLVVILLNARLFTGRNGTVMQQGSSEATASSESASSGDAKEPTSAIDGKNSENFLICGLDESEELTDVIMLVTVDYKKNTVNILQIPRDSYVKDDSSSTGKINSVYHYGDKSLTPINRLIKVINNQYDIKVDHYMTVTLKSFRSVIDAIGGVPINLPQTIGSDEYGYLYEGEQVLDGVHAEWLVRHRKTYAEADIGRLKAQRLFMAALVEQVKKIGATEFLNLIPAMWGQFTTDLTAAELADYAKFGFGVEMSNISMFLLPGEGVMYNGQGLWSMHYYETADLLNKHFRPYSDPVPAEELGITELAHTGEYYENTEDNLGDVLETGKTGTKKEDDAMPVYTHIVTAPPKVTTTAAETLVTSIGDDGTVYVQIDDGNGGKMFIGEDELSGWVNVHPETTTAAASDGETTDTSVSDETSETVSDTSVSDGEIPDTTDETTAIMVTVTTVPETLLN